MSSSTSSSSHSQRTPLHERTNSEKNIHQIRLVPYSPPKIDAEDARSRISESTGSLVRPFTPKDRSNSISTQVGRERFIGSARSSPSSSSSPITSSTWVKGKGVSELSGTEHPTPPARAVLRTSRGGHGYVPTQQLQEQRDNGPALSPTLRKPRSRRTSMNIHSDGTFSLVEQLDTRVSTGSQSTVKSYSHSNTSFFSSREETSFDAPTDDHPSSLFSSFPERSISPASPGTPATSSTLKEDPTISSWNYRMTGGLRQVSNTPDSKIKGKGKEIAAESLPFRPVTTAPPRVVGTSSPLTIKTSFSTENSDSTFGGTNFKVVGRSSPPAPDSESIDAQSSSGSSNYQLIGQSSAPQSFASSPAHGHSILDTPGSKNFIVHGSPYPASEQAVLETPGSRNFIVHSNISPSPSVYPVRASRSQVSDDSFKQQSRGTYSQESLVIPPLRPHKRSSSENLYLKRTSRETLHTRSNSYSSVSSGLTQDSGLNVVVLGHTPSASSSSRQGSWAGRRSGAKSRMDVHQWNAQLSPVMSEYEGSDRGSRMASLNLLAGRGTRNIQSISSSLFDNLEPTQAMLQTHSRSGSLEQPGPAFMRGAREGSNPPFPTVRDHDEHGDGLADLQEMHQLQSKSSRSRLGFLSRHSSDRSSRSTSSSRSLGVNSLPTWARVYYGSGERRWLASSFIISEGDDSPPPSSWVPSGSPPAEQFHQEIYNPRRRPREVQNDDPHAFSPEISPVEIEDIPRRPKKKSSSIWSPHLRPDRWASRYPVWQPPPVAWSAENPVFGRRNIQVILFVLGFIFPFAWMIAAFLPLPPNPQFDMQERNKSTARFRMPDDSGPEPFHQQVGLIDDSRYQSARWWRNLNRYMSIIGLLILGAIVALIVVGIKQGW
ncbi:hypothetical protein F5Y14DRAFT_143414 [Nemania sp. NC0429]|nr:hypothetical protein F5Y14DRAFT_143414 [Nemania sp. NC0429]